MDTAEPEAAAPVGKDGWFTGAGAAVLQATTEDAAMAVDTAAVEKAVNWKAMPKGALLKMKVAGVCAPLLVMRMQLCNQCNSHQLTCASTQNQGARAADQSAAAAQGAEARKGARLHRLLPALLAHG